MTLLRQKITGGRGKSIASVIEQIEKSFVFLLLLQYLIVFLSDKGCSVDFDLSLSCCGLLDCLD